MHHDGGAINLTVESISSTALLASSDNIFIALNPTASFNSFRGKI